MRDLLQSAFERSAKYLEGLDERSVAPRAEAVERLVQLGGAMPESPQSPEDVLALLDEIGSPATVATAGGRYFGFVIGGALPATLAANWLAGAWDQNAGMETATPVGAALEDIALEWMREIFHFPSQSGGAFVTGATMANFTGLAAARHALLKNADWDAESDGLFGAPALRVVVGDEVHVSLLKALGLLGLGRARVEKVPVDDQGRMRADTLPELDDRTILCIQAGNVNTGAFDPAPALIDAAHEAGAWVHVDGAFGLWAAASPAYAHLYQGFEDADSLATDAHKWLNVPYDSGLAFCRDAMQLEAAMSHLPAAYLGMSQQREPMHFTPEMSRRARGIEIWAALRSLGKEGLAAMIERNCQGATWLAAGLREAGHDVLNDVVLNQVLVSFGDEARTNNVIEAIQADGALWGGGTVWQGQHALRLSVSSWATTSSDLERTLDAIFRLAG